MANSAGVAINRAVHLARDSASRFLLFANSTCQDKSLAYGLPPSYRLKGKVVKVFRELNFERHRSICNAKDDQEWSRVLTVLQRDLRGQFFFK